MTIEMLDVRGERLPRSRPPGTSRLSEAVGPLTTASLMWNDPLNTAPLEYWETKGSSRGSNSGAKGVKIEAAEQSRAT